MKEMIKQYYIQFHIYKCNNSEMDWLSKTYKLPKLTQGEVTCRVHYRSQKLNQLLKTLTKIPDGINGEFHQLSTGKTHACTNSTQFPPENRSRGNTCKWFMRLAFHWHQENYWPIIFLITSTKFLHKIPAMESSNIQRKYTTIKWVSTGKQGWFNNWNPSDIIARFRI